MKRGERLSFGKGDAAAIAGVLLAALLLAVFLLLPRTDGRVTVRIFLGGKLLQEMPLDQDAEYTVRGEYTNHVVVRDGRVSVDESDCPGEDCVHSGWISRPGRSVVCLPNRMEVRLEGREDDDPVDAVIR